MTEIDAFLSKAGWSGASRRPLAGDASARRYERVARGADRAVLMIVPDDGTDSTRRFVGMTRWLRGQGFSAPEILAEEPSHRLLLLEDLGDAVFAALLKSKPVAAAEVYGAAVGFLADLGHRSPPQSIKALDVEALAELVSVIPDWYLPAAGLLAGDSAYEIAPCLAKLYEDFGGAETVVSLRDFHAENLIWLPERAGSARLGLLDYQDAVLAHPAYDLVSLLQDARREVPVALETEMVATYLSLAGLERDPFLRIYVLLGAQRALRILGVFARLCLRDGKPRYVDMIPRVDAALRRNLIHPDLAPLARLVTETLPSADDRTLAKMRAACRRPPAPL